ncbi:hypothetical protein ACQ4M3_01035 [Leptolyngbya sp. AN03gr2]|uniref:hypothetical protein n=1 Tax=unclassified Leptolyngbya TaxID=2650499 RepID=UPI003D310C55
MNIEQATITLGQEIGDSRLEAMFDEIHQIHLEYSNGATCANWWHSSTRLNSSLKTEPGSGEFLLFDENAVLVEYKSEWGSHPVICQRRGSAIVYRTEKS